MADQTNAAPQFWWQKEDETEAAKNMFALAGQLRQDQMYREADLLLWLKLYVNRNIAGIGAGAYLRPVKIATENERLTLNVVESCIDTVHNKMSGNKPRPMFVTDAGDWKQKQRAKKLNRFGEGLFYECKIHPEITPTVRKDALWSGTGIATVFEDGDEVTVEWVPPSELTVDEGDAIYGKPRSIYRDRLMARTQLLALYADEPDKLALIHGAKKAQTDGESRADLVLVREGWHLPSKTGAKDGRWIRALSNGSLESEQWNDGFPFAVLPYKKRPLGFWGGGLAEELSGIQMEINYTAQKIQRMLKMATSRIYVRRQAKIPKTTITNEAGSVTEVDDPTDLHVDSSNSVPSEFFAHLDRLWARAFEKAGVSQMAATGKKPAGLDSGAAQREYNDTTTERMSGFLGNDEEFHVQLGKLLIAAVRRIAKRNGGSYKVRLPGKGKLEWLDWKDVEMDEKSFVLKCFPVSSLPSSPAARFQTLQEWFEAGLIDATEFRRQMNAPDLEDSTNLATAQYDDILASISAIMDDDEPTYTDPEPYQNLELGKRLFTAAMLRARLDHAPEERLDMLRQWIDAANDLTAPPPAPAAAAPPMAAGAPPMPGAAPMPMPAAPPVPVA